MLNLIFCLITGLYQNEPMTLYLPHTAATQGSQVSDQETQLPADQVGNGQLCLTGVNQRVRHYSYTNTDSDTHYLKLLKTLN